MDFSLTEDQVLLRDTARGLLVNECPTTMLRDHITDPSAADRLTAHLGEFVGLGGGDLTDLAIFVEELGYVAAPGPFFANTALFAPLLAALGSPLLDDVLEGTTTGTVALAGTDGSWRVNGETRKTFVPEADRVEWIAVVDEGPTVRLTQGLPTRLIERVDTTRRLFDVDTTGEKGETFEINPDALAGAIERATVALSAEMVGTARRMFDMTLQYAKERIQFDVPIGSFQAMQHKLADMSLAIERATSAVQYAAMTLTEDDVDRHRATHVAKAAAGAAVTRAAKDGIQIHGGIGYTWEHDLHLFMRRAYGSETWMGTTGYHHDRLADLLIA
ncbi:MAG: Acyl-CoA dehydrogenase FadE34 [Actinomycetia bacterium]|nr:Acyl-CoA dehydrogenase FadE34 [Actinomycetes bacterium]